MAFQPIVDVRSGTVFAYEALVRGLAGEPAPSILRHLNEENRYAFDQACRVKALELAARLGLGQTGAHLSINFMPGAVYSPAACIQLTLRTAQSVGFPLNRIIFEIVESEAVSDIAHLRGIVKDYRERGFLVAIDDFGAAHAGFNLLADFPADIVKLDGALTRDLDQRPAARAIVHAMAELSTVLGFSLVAEGIETEGEYHALRECGVSLMQGYLFARPAFEALPPVTMPSAPRAVAGVPVLRQ